MRPASLTLAALVLVACTEDAPAPPELAPEPAPVEHEEAPAPLAPPLAASTRPWRWVHEGPARDATSFGDGAIHERAAVHEVGAPRRFVVTREGTALVIVREDRAQHDPPAPATWTRRYEIGATGAPVIGVADHRTLYAAAPSGEEHVVLSLDPADGQVRWERRGEGGPVQLGFEADTVVVYVRTADGPRLVELDASDGAARAHARFSAAVGAAYPRPTTRALRRGVASPEGYRLVRDGRGIAITAPSGATRLADDDPITDHAAFVDAGDVLVVVTFCSGASGASAFGVARDGTLRFAVSPGSIGTIGHSRYGNDVRAARAGELVVVHGDESAGRYVGVLDPREGRLLGYEVWRR
ncbi:MAG: PQQ-binding-like beta-propeller repeat protein [Sandaracinaceae bacterium]|nr:PQQ-binding-like beta-propeller repeat protein [Sandaracinaceae bacterium]